jgi:hypothetical protein
MNRRRIPGIMNFSMQNALPIAAEENQKEVET